MPTRRRSSLYLQFRARNFNESNCVILNCEAVKKWWFPNDVPVFYKTRSPVDGERLISIDALLLLFTLFKLLLLLPSAICVPDASNLVSCFVSWRWTCGMPFTRPCCGAASGTMRRKKPLAQPHGNTLQHLRN